MWDPLRQLVSPGGLLKSDTALNQASYYEASVQRPPARPALQGRVQADVAVVGAGFAGLSAAIELQKRGRQVVVLEAATVGFGASGRNGGQAIVGYASGQGPFEDQLGEADARRAWNMSLQAIDLIDQNMAEFGIDCDRVNGYLYVADSRAKARALLADMEDTERRYGFQTDMATGADVARHIASPLYHASAFENRSGHLHPLKYALGLARAAQSLGVTLHEGSPVVGLQHGAHPVLTTPHGEVHAAQVVLAGNCMLPEFGPRVAPDLAPRVMPVGTYIIGTAPLPPELCAQLIPSNAAVCDNNFVLDYFRFSADHRLLFGGRVSYTTKTPADLKNTMRQRMVKVFPALRNVEVEYVWGGFVDISMNRAPDFGRVGQGNVYYLQGFSGHGVALTGLAGRLVAEAMAGDSERFDVFARLRHREFPGGPLLRTPSLALGMLWHRLKDAVG